MRNLMGMSGVRAGRRVQSGGFTLSVSMALVWCLAIADQKLRRVLSRQLRDEHHTKPMMMLERFPPDVNRTAVGWVKRSATQHLTACTKVVGSRPAEEAGLDPTYVENALVSLMHRLMHRKYRNELRRISRYLRCGTLVLFLLSIPGGAGAAAEPMRAGPLLVYDADSGRVVYAEDADRPWYPASLTKMMTAYLLFEAWAEGKVKPTDTLTISAHANSQPRMRFGLGTGKSITFEDAAKALIIVSANDIAVAIAEALEGNELAFVDRMNRTAYRLGMYGTRYINPNGLPGEGQHTTARDLALLAEALFRDFPQHRGYFSMRDAQVGRRRIATHNSVLINVAGGDGMKTGFTCSAGYNIVASATRDGRRMVAVVLGAPSSSSRALRAAQMLEYGFLVAGWKALLPGPSVAALPETAWDRQKVREDNLTKRYKDCFDPLPVTIAAVADSPVAPLAPAVLASAIISAAVEATLPEGGKAHAGGRGKHRRTVRKGSKRRTGELLDASPGAPFQAASAN